MTQEALELYLAIAPRSPEAHVLRLLVELGVQCVHADEGSLLVLDKEKEDLVFCMTAGSSESTLIGQRVPLGEGLTGLAAVTHEVQIGSATFDGVTQTEEHSGSRAPHDLIAAPMLAAGELVGVVTAVNFGPERHFSGEHAQLFGRIAAVAGLVIQQRQQLDAAHALQTDAREFHTVESNESLESQITKTVIRIARTKPNHLAQVAAILSGIEALCSG